MPDIRLHNVVELTPALMAELAAGGYRAVRDPDLVIYVADQAPVISQGTGDRGQATEETAEAEPTAIPEDLSPLARRLAPEQE